MEIMGVQIEILKGLREMKIDSLDFIMRCGAELRETANLVLSTKVTVSEATVKVADVYLNKLYHC